MLSSTTKSEQDQESKYKCAKCRDEEVVLIVELDEKGKKISEIARDCECKKARVVQRMMKSSRITPEFQSRTFQNFERNGRPPAVQEAYQAAFEFTKGFADGNIPRGGVALLGRPGCGKTHLLMAVSNHLLENGIQVLYFPFVEGFGELRGNLDTLDDRIRQLQQAEVLYIDDLFKGRKDITDFVIEQVFAIINYRYSERKPVLISSEKSVAQLCEIDEGIGSRIYEMCKDHIKVLNGGIELNYRLRG